MIAFFSTVDIPNGTTSTPDSTSEGVPSWIGDDLLSETKMVWQLQYAEDLTNADAVSLLQTVGELFEILYEGWNDETPGEETP